MPQYSGVESNRIADALKELVKFFYQLNIGENFDKTFAGWSGHNGYIHAISRSQSDDDLAEALGRIEGLSTTKGSIYSILEAVVEHAEKSVAEKAFSLIEKLDEFRARGLISDFVFATVYTEFDKERDMFLQKVRNNEPIELRPVPDADRSLTIKRPAP